MAERQPNLNASEIKQMMDNTRNLQNKAAQTLESAISGRIPVFDPRSSDAQEENTGAAVIWSTKSIELAYKALKDGYSLRKSPFFRGNISLRKANLNFQYTQEELEEIIKCKNDIIYFANTYCYLKTENGKRHIVLRPYQEKLLRNYQNNRFNITLASRQIGKCIAYNSYIKIKDANGNVYEVMIGDLFYHLQKHKTIKDRIIHLLWHLYDKIDKYPQHNEN